MKVQDFIQVYHDGKVHISNNVEYNLRDVIEKNDQMRNGLFEDPYFEDGETRKQYYNVVFGFADTLKRGSQLKISEFSLTNLTGQYQPLVDTIKMGLKHHLKYNGFVELKNDVLSELVDMGHVLTKVVDGETKQVNLQNFIFRPDIDKVQEAGGCEYIYMTYDEAKGEFGDGDHWKEIEEWYDQMDEMYKPYLTFVEHWTVDSFTNEEKKKERTKGCIKYLDRSGKVAEELKRPEEWAPYLEIDRFASPHFIKSRNKREKRLYGEKRRVFPYDEERLIKVPGRYLGMGAYELCRPAQEDYNEKLNMKRKFDLKALRGIMVHKIGNMRRTEDGEALTQEFIKRMDTGANVKIFNDESIERLDMGSTTGDTLAMIRELFEVMRFMLGITQQATGETSTNKTATFAVEQAQTQQSTYQIIKKKVGRLFERLFQNFLLEDIIEEITSRKFIALSGEPNELEQLSKLVIEQEVYDQVAKSGEIMTDQDVDALIEARMAQVAISDDTRFLEAGDEFKKAFKSLVKNLEYIVEFNITDEAMDLNSKIDTMIKADTIQNPKIKAKILDMAGIRSKDVELTEEEKQKALAEEVQRAQAMSMAESGGLAGLVGPQAV